MTLQTFVYNHVHGLVIVSYVPYVYRYRDFYKCNITIVQGTFYVTHRYNFNDTDEMFNEIDSIRDGLGDFIDNY